MTRLLVLVEGDSEELFVNRMLKPHLESFGVYAFPTLVETKRLASGGKMGGGNNWAKIRATLLPLLNSHAWVTTILDFYGLGDDVPGIADARKARVAREGVKLLEESFSEVMGQPRCFIPFFSLHEFEAWYFSAPDIVGQHFGNENIARELSSVVRQMGSPEDINHGPDTHPSARLKALKVGFRKTSAVTLLEKIGLPTIRGACPHFNAWLSRLETLADDPLYL